MDDLPYYTDICVLCRQHKTVEIDPRDIQGMNRWLADRRNSPYIQDAMPHTSADAREFIMSGCCPECFDRVFPPDDDD